MPLTLAAEIVAAKNAVYSDVAFYDLLEVRQAGGGIHRLVNNNQDVTWNDNQYTKFRVENGDREQNTDGGQDAVNVRVSNVSGYMQGVLEADPNGMIGDTVIYRYVMLASATPAIEEWFSVLSAVAEDQWVTFSLGAENLFLNRFPAHVFARNTCRYRPYMTDICVYTNQSSCDRRFSTCIGLGRASVFGGQPGIPGGAFDV